MAGELCATEFFCALVGITSGVLDNASIHVEEKRVGGLERWKGEAYLVQISDNKVWASFYDSNDIWLGEFRGDELVMTKHPDQLPVEEGFDTVPLGLPDRRFLAAGGCPSSTDITLITPGERFSFDKVGDMPGEGKDDVSTILIGERFVVGFGGRRRNYHPGIDDMWIFDLKTHKVSSVKKEGEWHPSSSVPALVVRNQDFYVIGSWSTHSVHCLPFTSLSHLIQRGRVRCAFCSCLGFPFRPGKGFKRSAFRHYSPPSL